LSRYLVKNLSSKVGLIKYLILKFVQIKKG
jgi:hypothetical protein